MSVPRRARAWLAVSVAVAITASVAIGGAAHAANDAPEGKVAYDKNADLTFAYAAGPNGLDPVRPGFLYTFMALIYDRLTQINDNLEVKPMLAESWEFAKDGSTLEFKLRSDATFTDGTKIDAAAVKANLDRARSAPVQHPLERAQVDHERHRGQSDDGAPHAGSRPGRAAPVRPRVERWDDREPEGDR